MNKSGPLTPEQFRFIVRHTPLVSIDLVIIDSTGYALVGLRNNEPAKSTYFVPGGIIFKDERIEAAFRRILLAETGLAAQLSDAVALGIFEHFYSVNRFNEPGYGTHYIVNAFRLSLVSRPSIISDDQHRDLKWVSLAEINTEPNVHPYTKAYFQ